jgi:hypothetical protein
LPAAPFSKRSTTCTVFNFEKFFVSKSTIWVRSRTVSYPSVSHSLSPSLMPTIMYLSLQQMKHQHSHHDVMRTLGRSCTTVPPRRLPVDPLERQRPSRTNRSSTARRLRSGKERVIRKIF